jgi:hypothetical protein
VELGHEKLDQAIRYVIRKPLYYRLGSTDTRIDRAKVWARDSAMKSLAATYGMDTGEEPFAMLHAEY